MTFLNALFNFCIEKTSNQGNSVIIFTFTALAHYIGLGGYRDMRPKFTLTFIVELHCYTNPECDGRRSKMEILVDTL